MSADAQERVDVIVVGAGAAGLATSALLTEAGLSVIILEASTRIGGRVRSVQRPDRAAIELGAQVIHGRDVSTLDLVTSAAAVTQLEPPSEFRVAIGDHGFDMSELIGAGIDAPWDIEYRVAAQRRIGDTFGAALSRLRLEPASIAVARAWIGQLHGVSADSLDASVAGIDDETQLVVNDGYSTLLDPLARASDIRFDQAARAIDHTGDDEVRVVTPTDVFVGRAAVITAPPTVVASDQLRFEPPLPHKVSAASALDFGDAVVILVTLRQRAPLTQWGLRVGGTEGYWRSAADDDIVVGWVKGPSAESARDLLATPETVAAHLGPLFPWVDAAAIASIDHHDWGLDPWAGGCYPAPGLDRLAAETWAAPVGNRLFFAGDSTATDSGFGRVHGALDSAARVAAEVKAALAAH